nr:MAG TPA: hypothetical protein [Caudoviricetes sp.]
MLQHTLSRPLGRWHPPDNRERREHLYDTIFPFLSQDFRRKV